MPKGKNLLRFSILENTSSFLLKVCLFEHVLEKQLM